MQKAKQRFSIILLLAASMLLWQMLSPNGTAQVMARGSQQEDPVPIPEVTSEESPNVVIEVMLTGDAEVPNSGDEDGAGLAVLTFDTDANTVCYTIEIEDIDTPTAGHIHEGVVGVSGGAVVPLFEASADATVGCATSDEETVKKILDNPDGYYVNIHNAEFPSGAVRGQLSREEESGDVDAPVEEGEDAGIPAEEIEAPNPSDEASTDTNRPEQATSIVISVTLTGVAEVPGPGDEDGAGTAILTFDTISNTVCYELETENIDAPTAGHIHAGAADASGDAVVPLFGDSADAAEGCATPDPETFRMILGSPANYYVNIHNEAFPSGAIRGQLPVQDRPEGGDRPVEDNDESDRPEQATSIVISVMLTGTAEVPGPGDEDGAGTAILTFDTISNTVCYELETENIDAPTKAHIHEGAADASGSSVVTLFSDSADVAAGCAESDTEMIKKILGDPANYYVNIHNEAFPGGAIRGQLPAKDVAAPNEDDEDRDTSDEDSNETDKPEQVTSIVISVMLTGAAEVPGPGDEDGAGTAILTFDTISNTVCYELETENIDAPTAGHIHAGAADASGDAVVPLFGDSADAAEGCATSDEEMIKKILGDPASYYVNIHNEAFPGGAIRGQLPAKDVAAPNEDGEDRDTSDEDSNETDTPEQATSIVISVMLTGIAEVPGPGDEDGAGTAILTFDTISNTVCYELETENIDAPTAGHIHAGAADASGDAVVPLFGDSADAAEGCATSDEETIKKILGDLANYYVNIHNEAFPGGAIRGQLPAKDVAAPNEDDEDRDTSDEDSNETDTPEQATSIVISVMLTGIAEVPALVMKMVQVQPF